MRHLRSIRSIAAAASVTIIAALGASAQHPTSAAHAPTNTAHARPTVPALFLSDVHFDPFHDPAQATRLISAPIAEWNTILSTPPSPTQETDFNTLQQVCQVRGTDTSATLWRSSLNAMHAQAGGPAFVTVSGDLLAHGFQCKFKKTFPTATDKDYLLFVTQTIRYIVRGLQLAFPRTPLYVAMGNNDSACGDYRDDAGGPFLAAVAPIVAQALPPDDRATILRDFARDGSYSAPMPAILRHARILVLDDLFLSAHYATCDGTPDETAGARQVAWLRTRLADARDRGEHVWVLGHIPPGVDLYATLRSMGDLCRNVQPRMFLANERLAAVLAENEGTVRLAIFGHSHTDELRLLTRDVSRSSLASSSSIGAKDGGVPVKIVSSISPVNGNSPSFTIARVDPATADLVDYTVIAASNLTGIGTAWKFSYTFSNSYQQPSFTAGTLLRTVTTFQSDPNAATPASDTYLRNIYIGDRSPFLKPLWPEYVCALIHDSAESFTGCVCKK